MTRGILGDDTRFRATWERFPGFYFAGDGARVDEDGDFWLLGCVDDVMNVSSHRISTSRSSRRSSTIRASRRPRCAGGPTPHGSGDRRLRDAEGRGGGLGGAARRAPRPRRDTKIGPIAKPANIVFTLSLEDASGSNRRGGCSRTFPRPAVDTTTLADPAVVAEIADRAVAQPVEEQRPEPAREDVLDERGRPASAGSIA